MPKEQVNPQDATGAAAEKARKKTAEDKKREKDEITTARQQEQEELSTKVFDPKTEEETVVIDEVEEIGVSVQGEQKVVIRTVTDIEDMTFGVGNNYNFKAGVKYSVPRELAAHLERLGYVWTPGN